jgi:hypothetical protein
MKRVSAPKLLHSTDSLLHVLVSNLCSSSNKQISTSGYAGRRLDVDYSKDLG